MVLRRFLSTLFLIWPTCSHATNIHLDPTTLGNVFTAGNPASVLIHSDVIKLSWHLRDFFGTESGSGTFDVSHGETVLRLPISSPGYFTLTVSSSDGTEATTAIAFVPKPRPAEQNSPFGVMTHFAKGWPTDVIPLIEMAGIHRVRDEQPWRKIERNRGSYTFPAAFTTYMETLKSHDIDPLLVLAFSNPLYDDDKTPYSDEGRQAFAAYAAAVAKRYGNEVSALEVWNEYNGSFCDGPCASDRPRYYADMLKQTYSALKASDSTVTVVGAAAVPIPIDFFRGLFRAGVLSNLDAIVIHPYRKTPEGVEDKIAELRTLMVKYGKEKPIWATEYGDLADMKKSRDDVARYLVRMTTLLLSANVERVYWYLLKDYQDFSGLGLVRSGDDPMGRYVANPAYVAYATLIHELDGARFVRREQAPSTARVYLFSNGKMDIRVAWAPDGPVQFHLQEPSQTIDMMGARRTTATGGMTAVTLDNNPVYLLSKTRSE